VQPRQAAIDVAERLNAEAETVDARLGNTRLGSALSVARASAASAVTSSIRGGGDKARNVGRIEEDGVPPPK
jgi:hypothetical protein